jgi:tetratricopeptide (TPR) repeat protein
LAAAIERYGQNHTTTIAIKIDLAEVLGEYRDMPEAEKLLEEALESRRDTLGAEDLTVAETLDRLAGIATRRGDDEKAVDCLRQALAIHRVLVPPQHPMLIESLVSLAKALDKTGASDEARDIFAEAEPHVRRALQIHRSVLGDRHVMTLVLANDLGELLNAMGDAEAAEKLFREAVDGCSVLLENDATDTERLRNNLAAAETNLATVLVDRGSADEARVLLEDAVALRREVFGDHHLMVTGALEDFGQACLSAGDVKSASAAFEEAVSIRSDIQGDEHPQTKRARATLERLQAKGDEASP